MEMNWEKYNLQVCHLLILQFLFLFVVVVVVGTETVIFGFLFRLLGSQFCCHVSITVWARKISFLSGVRGIFWKHFTCPNFWHESDQVADITHASLVITEGVENFFIDTFWDFISTLSSCKRIMCAGKDWTLHRKGLLKELNFVPYTFFKKKLGTSFM